MKPSERIQAKSWVSVPSAANDIVQYSPERALQEISAILDELDERIKKLE